MSKRRTGQPKIRPRIKTTRRAFMIGGTTATISIALPPIARAQTTMVSTIFGGAFEAAYRKHVVEPFQKANNAEVILKYGNSSEWVANSLLNRGNPEIDVIFLAYPDSIRAVNEELGMVLTPQDVPNVVNLHPVWYESYKKQAVGLDYASWGITYRTDSGVPAPTSWLDLFKPEYAGKVIVPNLTASGGFQTLVMMAKLHGGSEDNIEPGFEAMKKLKPNIRKFYGSNPEAGQLMERGDAVIGAMYDNATWFMTDGGKPIRWMIPKEGALVGMVSLHIAPKSKNLELCKKFVNFAISKEANEGFCNTVMAGPTNKLSTLAEPALSRVPKLDSIIFPDWYKIVKNAPKWIERWNREITG
jgi:putative spermidine/putrescine transport system substrate-binding protein